jgi:uncharacterized protein YfaQ (DUF2300 family)
MAGRLYNQVMQIRTVLALASILALAACSGPAKKGPAGPAADDVPQEVTCCFDPETEGAAREVKPVDRCPEEHRNPVDACNIGPGENEQPM